MCHNRSKIPHDSVSEEWLDPRECVELVQRFSGDVKCIHDLFLAIRINMLLRRGYGKTNFNFIFSKLCLLTFTVVSRVWVEKFVAENGIDQLVAPLQVSGGASVETCNEVLSTLFVLSNSNSGAQGIVKTRECFLCCIPSSIHRHRKRLRRAHSS